ncbi:MAG TPA: hypothetical protein VG269_16870 [Tepidisphaeraceae bacterium]|jgi:hypothetical protein|nr:hypothetical protein [Tepidisphaeraceae bacterium]
MHNRLLLLLLLALVAGCAPTETYTVSLKNQTPRPITAIMTKDGPPFEKGWASPEDVAADRVAPDEVSGIQVIPEGRTGTNTGLSGHFDKGTHAILRVYDGKMLPSEMLRTQPGRSRVDTVLHPGENRFVARETADGLVVEPAAPRAP